MPKKRLLHPKYTPVETGLLIVAHHFGDISGSFKFSGLRDATMESVEGLWGLASRATGWRVLLRETSHNPSAVQQFERNRN
jgi:hypothetical protein